MKHKSNGIRKTKIYRDMVISFEARLQDLRNQLVRQVENLDKVVAENFNLKSEKKRTLDMLEVYEQELSKLRNEASGSTANLVISERSARAWETVAIEFAQENARLVQQIRMK
jgi:hypothetical protein